MPRTTPWPSVGPSDRAAVHHFIRVHGRRPAPDEVLVPYQAPAPALTTRVPSVLRREAARLITRL